MSWLSEGEFFDAWLIVALDDDNRSTQVVVEIWTRPGLANHELALPVSMRKPSPGVSFRKAMERKTVPHNMRRLLNVSHTSI